MNLKVTRLHRLPGISESRFRSDMSIIWEREKCRNIRLKGMRILNSDIGFAASHALFEKHEESTTAQAWGISDFEGIERTNTRGRVLMDKPPAKTQEPAGVSSQAR